MALNKRKVLEAARKFAQKGAKEKALKEYAKLLKADSRDAKLLLEIGDAHRRWGQNEEAISHYIRVAEQYKQGGFDARAVAVFKQILNLDSKRYAAYVSLAELYQRMGLDAEAVGALQTAADGYHSDGQKPEALELLRKMATLDPSNTTSRMKVAELLRQEELLDEAISEYEAIVEEMVRQGATDALIPVYERILEIRPERCDIEFALARNLVQLSQPGRAEPFARSAFDQQVEGDGHFDLLVGIYTELDRTDELTVVTKVMAKHHRDRGEEDEARELMQRLPSDNAFELSDGGTDATASTDAAADDDSALEDDGFLDDDFLVVEDESDDVDGDDFELDGDGDDDDFELDMDDEFDSSSSADLSPPVGDPDQLFAEASVYLRYGKRDQAITSLEAVLALEPNHRGAIEKIGEFYADGGDTPKAVEHWITAANLAASAGDASAVENLRERIAVLDPSAAQALAPDIAEAASDEAGATIVDPIDLDAEVDLVDVAVDDNVDDAVEVDVDDIDVDAFPSTEPEAPEAEEEVDLELDIEIDSDEDSAASSSVAVESEEDKLNESLDGVVFDTSSGVEAGGASAQANLTASSLQHVTEDLEEAEFYMEQELYDEAEAIFNRVLEVAPNHPSAMLRLGEIRAARGEDPSAPVTSAASASDVTLDPADLPFEASEDEAADGAASDEDDSVALGENSELEIAVDIDVEVDAEVDEEDDEESEEEAEVEFEFNVDDVEVEVDADASEEIDVEVEIDADAGDDAEDAADDAEADEEEEQVPDASVADQTIPLPADEDSASDVAASEPASDGDDAQGASGSSDVAAAAEVAQEDEDDSFDLAAELRETIEEEDSRAAEDDAASSSEATSEEEGFASIFKDFKSGVEKTLAEDDYDTRFDLGIAYRGMELYDDAIGEFQICLASPGHQVESLYMMGLCAIDLGRFLDASNHFEQALARDDLTPQKEAGLRFDLARSLESQGDLDRAVEALKAAKAADPTIPGIDDYIAKLAEQVASTSGPVELADTESSSEGFENFDDLVAEVEAEDAEEETFESFDDVIAEAEASQIAAEEADSTSTAEAPVEAEAVEASKVEGDPDPEASGTETGKKKKTKKKTKKKKKRISVV